MSADQFGFDHDDEPLSTVDRVGLQDAIKPPTDVLTRTLQEDERRAEVYDYHARGYPKATIAKKLSMRVIEVHRIIEEMRTERHEERLAAAGLTVEDAIAYYQRIKIEAEDRAKYSEDKAAPEFLKIAMEAQNRLDKLMGHEGEKSSKLPGDGDLQGLVIYREGTRARVLPPQPITIESATVESIPA